MISHLSKIWSTPRKLQHRSVRKSKSPRLLKPRSMKLQNCIVQLPLEVHLSISFFQICQRFIHSTSIHWKASSMSLIALSMILLKEWRPKRRCLKLMLKEKLSFLRLKPEEKTKRKLRLKENLLREKPSPKNQKKDNLKKESLKPKKVHQQLKKVTKRLKLFLSKTLSSESLPLSTQSQWLPSISPEEVSLKSTNSLSPLCLPSESSKEVEISTPKKLSISSSEKQIPTHHPYLNP